MRDNPKTKPNHIFTIVCISIVFSLIGMIGLVLIHSNNFLKQLENNLVAMVELDADMNTSDIETIKSSLMANASIEASSVKFVSKEEALKIMYEELGNEVAVPGKNPFFNAFTFKVLPAYRNQANLRQLQHELTENAGLLNFHFPERIAQQFSGFIRTFILASVGIVLLFLLLGIFLIINTIKLSLYANRFLIKNMQIVGAPWQFIRGPFIRAGLINGLISSLIAISLLVLIILVTVSSFPQIKQVFDVGLTGLLLCSLLVTCLLTCWASTKIGVDFYLKQKLEKLY